VKLLKGEYKRKRNNLRTELSYMRTNQQWTNFLAVMFIIIWLLAGCAGPPTVNSATATPQSDIVEPIVSTSADTSTPITVKLILSKAPRLDEPADLTVIVSSVLDAPGTTTEILLPEGAVLVNGKLTWSGDLVANQQVQLQATIKFVKQGNWTIEAKARRELENGDVWGDAVYIYLHVTENAGQVGFPTQPPSETGEQEEPTPPSVEPQP
jgi:hypothetical protein